MIQLLNKKIILPTLLLFSCTNLFSDEISFYKNQIIDLSKYGETIEISNSKIKYEMLNYKYNDNVEQCKIIEKNSLICNVNDNDSFYILLDIYKNGNKITKDLKLKNVPYVSSIKTNKNESVVQPLIPKNQKVPNETISEMKVEDIQSTVILNRKLPANQQQSFDKPKQSYTSSGNESEEMKVLNIIIQEQKNELERLRKNGGSVMEESTKEIVYNEEQEKRDLIAYDSAKMDNEEKIRKYENLRIEFDKYKNNVKEKIILIKQQYDYDMNKNNEMIENLKKMIELKSKENIKQNNIINDLNKKIKEQAELLQIKDIAVQNFQ